MQQSFTSIPFKADGGLSEINGLAKFSPAGIVLEFESKFLGMINNGVKEGRISLDEILDVRFRRGFLKFGGQIQIRVKSIARLAEFPNKSGRVALKIRRADYDIARDAVVQFNKNLGAHREQLPLAHTPISLLFDEGEAETQELDEK